MPLVLQTEENLKMGLSVLCNLRQAWNDNLKTSIYIPI